MFRLILTVCLLKGLERVAAGVIGAEWSCVTRSIVQNLLRTSRTIFFIARWKLARSTAPDFKLPTSGVQYCFIMSPARKVGTCQPKVRQFPSL